MFAEADMYVFWAVTLLIASLTSGGLCDVTVVVMCNGGGQEVCKNVFRSSLPETLRVDDVNINVTALVLDSSGDFMENVRRVDDVASSGNDVGLLLGFGGSDVVNAVACVGEARGIVTMTYMESHLRHHIYAQNVIKLNPDHAGLAKALVKVISQEIIVNSFFLCQDVLVTDGFLQALSDMNDNIRFNTTNTAILSEDISDIDLHMTLLSAHDTGHRLLIVHTQPELLYRIVRIADSMSYFETGYAWIITEEGLPSNFQTRKSKLPLGLLAIDGYETNIYPEILKAVVNVFNEELQRLLLTLPEFTVPGVSNFSLAEFFKKHPTMADQFKRNISTNPKLFEKDGSRIMMQFRLLNYAEESTGRRWRTVGFISNDSVDLGTVVWPGPSIFGPATNMKESYIVVARPAKPFMFINGPVEHSNECPVNTACLEMHVHEADQIRLAVEVFNEGMMVSDMFTVFCCEGIVVDILSALSHQIDFDFVIYFHNDSDYGTLRNKKWSGMIGDVVSGAADIMAGAVSMTSERAIAVSFTESFYFSSFSMISTSNTRITALFAFTNPFDYLVWLTIICSATTVALATSLFEWNSPFGLNPWGKKRKKNYTLGSGLTMVYSIWFGHTVSTKSPKSWPSKVLQNFWACLAIFILASYTANLAAFLAGSVYEENLYSILNTELASKRVGAIKTTASDVYTKAVNMELHTRMSRYYVKDINEGIRKIRYGDLDLYMDDSPLLEYALAKQDLNCSIKVASHTFGDNAYAFGVKHGSWIKTKLDPYILNYVELGFVENLKWRYLGAHRQCQNKLISVSDLMFGFDETKGLFVMLLMAIAMSLLLLVCENMFYFLILPILKRKPANSIWKSRNVEYFSQRLYKAINSEDIEHQAQMLMSKMRQKKFSLQSKIRRQTNTVPTNLKSYMSNSGIPMDFITYNGHLKSNSERGMYRVRPKRRRYGKKNDGIFTITSDYYSHTQHEDMQGNVDEEDTSLDIDEVLRAMQARDAHECFENPVFESDTDDDGIGATTVDIHPDGSSGTNACNSPYVIGLHIRKDGRSESGKSGNKKYETWPSPKTRRRSLKKVSVDSSSSDRCVSPSPKSPNALQGHVIVNELSFDSRKKCRACSFSAEPSYQRSSSQYELKDNRIKSNLRQNAMASMPRSPSTSIDENTVEVLSKEDLLILWKRSEIELQTKLNRMLQQNNHLRTLVNIAETNEVVREAGSGNVISVRL